MSSKTYIPPLTPEQRAKAEKLALALLAEPGIKKKDIAKHVGLKLADISALAKRPRAEA